MDQIGQIYPLVPNFSMICHFNSRIIFQIVTKLIKIECFATFSLFKCESGKISKLKSRIAIITINYLELLKTYKTALSKGSVI